MSRGDKIMDEPIGIVIGRALDDLIDLIAANPDEAKQVDPRTWKKLMIYAPKEALDETEH